MRKWRGAGTLVFVAQVLVAMPVKLQSQNLATYIEAATYSPRFFPSQSKGPHSSGTH